MVQSPDRIARRAVIPGWIIQINPWGGRGQRKSEAVRLFYESAGEWSGGFLAGGLFHKCSA
jgi:hypothetical protein